MLDECKYVRLLKVEGGRMDPQRQMPTDEIYLRQSSKVMDPTRHQAHENATHE